MLRPRRAGVLNDRCGERPCGKPNKNSPDRFRARYVATSASADQSGAVVRKRLQKTIVDGIIAPLFSFGGAAGDGLQSRQYPDSMVAG